ncbi:MAG: propanediol dehydratase, partial [Brooklawnia sp.]|nr:propanediol dehydratase [Brooklawnia sp.]
RCLFITKAAGSQGTQNGSISCVGVPAAVPSGIRAILAENLIATMLDLECASGSDQTFTHSDLRRVARTLMQFVPGTDFICSGYSAVPNYDNMFAGSNWDAEDYDDWNILQRDLKIEGGLQPVLEDDVVAIRRKAARALQGVFRELGLPEITDAEVEAATYAHGSKDMPKRNMVEDMKAAEEMMKRNVTGLDVAVALSKAGFDDVANAVFTLVKSRTAGDYLHTSAIFDENFHVVSAVNYPNGYAGPQTGYQISDERWDQIRSIRHAISPESI